MSDSGHSWVAVPRLGVLQSIAMRNLDDQEISELLSSALVAHVAVIDGEVPYVGPLSFVYANDVLAFRTTDGRRLDAIRANPTVSVDIIETGPGVADWASVIITGEAAIVDSSPEAGQLVSRLIAKYRAAYGANTPNWVTDDGAHVVAITPTNITGRASNGVRPGRFSADS